MHSLIYCRGQYAFIRGGLALHNTAKVIAAAVAATLASVCIVAFADSTGVRIWSPIYDAIIVEPLSQGERLVKIMVKDHIVAEFHFSAATAATLAWRLGNINIPPPYVVFADSTGVRSWSPIYDAITVEPLSQGEQFVKITVKDEVVATFRLSAAAAAALAKKLCS